MEKSRAFLVVTMHSNDNLKLALEFRSNVVRLSRLKYNQLNWKPSCDCSRDQEINYRDGNKSILTNSIDEIKRV